LVEWFCCEGYCADNEKIYCPYGCENGACIKKQPEKGYRYAYWECLNGEVEKQGSLNSCKTPEIWKGYALDFCENKCTDDNKKCGVNIFGLLEECYTNESFCESYCKLECPYGYVDGTCNCECLPAPTMPSCPEPPVCPEGYILTGVKTPEGGCPSYYCEISTTTSTPEENCKKSEGVWKTFTSSCTDYCPIVKKPK
jgi:hypothetical protein